jgi:thiol-disulfide isomerase/thioredoxin
MKKFFLITFSALLLLSCGNKNQFTITGKIVPAKDGKIILFGFKDGQPVSVDTAVIEKGQFNFKGQVTMPELRLMAFPGQERYVAQLFVEPSKIDLTVYPDSFETNVIKGSKTQDIFQLYIDEMISFSTKEGGLKSRYGQAQATGNEDEMKAIQFEYQAMVENIQLFSRNYIKKYNTSPVAAYVYLMNFIKDAPAEELDSILKVFEPIKSSDFVVAIKKRADEMQAFSKGAKAPDCTLNGPDGSPISLSSLRGKYVLIDFWASWCKPCMIEMPNVIGLYADYKGKGFEILGVSLDRERQAWVTTIKAVKMDWLQVWDMEEGAQGAVATKYGVSGIPHTVLVDKEGTIIEVNLRGEDLKKKLAVLMP